MYAEKSYMPKTALQCKVLVQNVTQSIYIKHDLNKKAHTIGVAGNTSCKAHSSL